MPRAAYVARDPAAGISLASWLIVQAVNNDATSAKTTASGRAPPANATPAGIDAAIAAPGAMSVMLWNRTSRSPMALRLRPMSAIITPGGEEGLCADHSTCGPLATDCSGLTELTIALPAA